MLPKPPWPHAAWYAETCIFEAGPADLGRIQVGRALALLGAMPIQSYRDLEAWQLGMEFVVRVYAVTKSFPREEMYGLTSQLRRAAVAVPSNVSEGHLHGTKAYFHFVVVALGSLAEAETQLDIARRLRMASDDELETVIALAIRARQVLLGLRRSLAARI